MAFTALNGFDVEAASAKLVYENLLPKIQHIDGKGVTEKYCMPASVESVHSIDIVRILSYGPRFRQVGAQVGGSYAAANGTFANVNNTGLHNAPQSVHYSVAMDLRFDEGVPVTDCQDYENPIALKQIVIAGLVDTAALTINVATYAKQLEAFFRNGDNFDKGLTHTKGNIVAADVSAAEIADAVYSYNPATSGAAAKAFTDANASLSEGIPEIGAYSVPADARQAFISPKMDSDMKSGYSTNASESAARINATGFINPFTQSESVRVDYRTGLCGEYDGVEMFQFQGATKSWVYVALDILGTADDTDTVKKRATCRTLLDSLGGILVYGGGTLRGIVGPSVVANPEPFNGGVFILPKLKFGVEVLTGRSIKLIVRNANAWTAANIADLMNVLTFSTINGLVATQNSAVSGFNTSTTY